MCAPPPHAASTYIQTASKNYPSTPHNQLPCSSIQSILLTLLHRHTPFSQKPSSLHPSSPSLVYSSPYFLQFRVHHLFTKRSSSSHHTLTFFNNPSLNKSPTPLPPINPETLPNTLSPYLSSLFHSTLTHPFNTSQTFSLSSLLFNLYYNYAH